LISRKCSRLIAECYQVAFQTSTKGHSKTYYVLNKNRVYDFLFDNEFPGYFCNQVKQTYGQWDTREFKEYIMKLHTGESLVNGTPEWTWEQRKLLGQQYLNDLAEAIIQYKNSLEERFYGHVIRETT